MDLTRSDLLLRQAILRRKIFTHVADEGLGDLRRQFDGLLGIS
jgi:hypothetical protein